MSGFRGRILGVDLDIRQIRIERAAEMTENSADAPETTKKLPVDQEKKTISSRRKILVT